MMPLPRLARDVRALYEQRDDWTVQALRRDGGTVIPLPSTLDLVPEQYDFHEWGGPLAAEVAVFGDRADVVNLLDLVGQCITIEKHGLGVVWWGWVEALDVVTPRRTMVFSLEDMANRIFVEHDPGTGTHIAGPFEDAASIARYGRKEALIKAGKVNAAHAEAQGHWELAQRRDMQRTRTLQGGAVAGRLVLRGEYDLLDWQFALPNALLQGVDVDSKLYDDKPTKFGFAGRMSLGVRVFNPHPYTVYLATTTFAVKRHGDPPGTLVLRWERDNDGTPGGELARVNLAVPDETGGAIRAHADWVPVIALPPQSVGWATIGATAMGTFKPEGNTDPDLKDHCWSLQSVATYHVSDDPTDSGGAAFWDGAYWNRVPSTLR